MLGVGETDDDVTQTLADLRSVGVDVVTFGQYLQPSKRHMAVKKYVTPEEFEGWKVKAEVSPARHREFPPVTKRVCCLNPL